MNEQNIINKTIPHTQNSNVTTVFKHEYIDDKNTRQDILNNRIGSTQSEISDKHNNVIAKLKSFFKF